jgi:hypothetical protein
MASSNDPQNIVDMVQVKGEWLPTDDVLVVFANAFAVQCVKSEFILTFGVATPPITGAMTKEQLENLTIKVKPFVRIGITPERLVELVGVMQAQLRAYSEMELKN